MEEKTIIGRVGNKTITEKIEYYQANIPEEELTAKKNIIKKFVEQGMNANEVYFD